MLSTPKTPLSIAWIMIERDIQKIPTHELFGFGNTGEE